MIETEFLDQLSRFSLVVRKRVTSNYIGPRQSTAMGRGTSFRDHRIYAPGDDFRAIDWKVYARTDDLYIKNYEEERNLTLHIVVDASSSMNYGKPTSKFDYASMVGVGFAFLSMKDNEKFQFSTFSEDVDIFQPRRGMSHLASMIHYLNNLKVKGNSDMYNAMTKYNKIIGSKAMVILISDFLMPIEDIRETLYLLSKHEMRVIQVLDPVEKNLKLDGDFNLEDSETADKLRTFINPTLRLKYKQALEKHSAKIEEICNKMGVEYSQFTTDLSIFEAFYKMVG